MADDVELENPSKKARLDEDFDNTVTSDQAELETSHYSSFSLGETDLKNQRNAGEGGQTDDEHPETSKSSAEPSPDSDSDSNLSALSNMSGLSGEESWKPTSGPMSWVYRQMSQGMDPRALLRKIIPHETHIPDLDDLTLWKLVINIVCEPPPRTRLDHVNTLADVLHLMKTCKKIMVLTGAGVSVSCGIPDFRSRNGVYARLAVDYPNLPDPQAMFDIHYFRNDQRPFFKFAKEIFPGQFEPSKCHKFIRLIEDHGKLLRNYTQNIDTLEQVAGIKRVIQCHGSFATATCMVCGHKCTADDIKTNIMEQSLPLCPQCPADTPLAVMKPDIVFFGESLPEEFHNQMAADKEECDLLIVIGSSLKVRPVALIPNSLPANIPQVLINKEPLKALNFDVELLGDCDTIVSELCRQLGNGWSVLAEGIEPLYEVTEDQLLTPPLTPADTETVDQSQFKFEGSEVKPKDSLDDESQVDSSGIQDQGSVEDGVKEELSIKQGQSSEENDVKELSIKQRNSSETADTSCACADLEEGKTETSKNNIKTREMVSESENGSYITEPCDSSNLHHSTSASKSDLADKLHTEVNKSDKSANIKEATEGPVSESNDSKDEHLSEVSTTTGDKAMNISEAHSSDSNKSNDAVYQESMDIGETGETSESRKCSSTVCYGDKDTCGCSADINELRKMWKPAIVRYSVSKRLGPNQYCFMPPRRYVFPEAEVYTVVEGADSDNDSDSDMDSDDGLDDLSDIDGNSDPLNTSDEQFDKNNSCSELDNGLSTVEADGETLQAGLDGNQAESNTVKEQNVEDSSVLEKENSDLVSVEDSGILKEFGNLSPSKDIQYPLVTTSNELSESLIDNMDNLAKLENSI